MARIGFKKALIAEVSGTTYSGHTEFEKVIDEKFAPEFNSAELYANDGLAESDYSFKKGTLSLTIADDNDDLLAQLFDSEKNDDGIRLSVHDRSPEFGYGHIIPKLVSGVKKYKVEFFPRVKFTKVTSDNKTRGEGVEFNTTAIEATVYPLETPINGLDEGVWEVHKTLDELDTASQFLEELMTPMS